MKGLWLAVTLLSKLCIYLFVLGALPEAMANGCVRCTEKQKVNLERISRYLMEKRPKEWHRLIRKYDPQNLHKINKHPVYHN